MTAARPGVKVTTMKHALSSPPGRDDRPQRSYTVAGHLVEVPRLASGLHIVATPIGNLGDITLRALAALAGADLIACEDTRVTRRLLDRYAMATPLTPYHDHNAETARPKLLRRLAEGAAIALVSDAGTPLVSDPGYKLARAAHEAGYAVTAATRGLGAARRLDGRRPPDRSVFLCRVPAAEGNGAPQPHRRACPDPGDSHFVRRRVADRRDARRPRRRTRRPRGRSVPRAHQDFTRKSGAATSSPWRRAPRAANCAASSCWSSDRRPRSNPAPAIRICCCGKPSPASL